jgi:DNA-binding transcriptional LysR family regulator
VRLALAEDGRGVTYLSDRLLQTLSGYHPVPGLDISSFERQVGLYYKDDHALSEAAKRFMAVCERHFGHKGSAAQ